MLVNIKFHWNEKTNLLFVYCTIFSFLSQSTQARVGQEVRLVEWIKFKSSSQLLDKVQTRPSINEPVSFTHIVARCR